MKTNYRNLTAAQKEEIEKALVSARCKLYRVQQKIKKALVSARCKLYRVQQKIKKTEIDAEIDALINQRDALESEISSIRLRAIMMPVDNIVAAAAAREAPVEAPAPAKKRQTYKKARFQRGSGTYVCQSCGKTTMETGDGESGCRVCRKCYVEGGMENAVSDGQIKCPDCGEMENILVVDEAYVCGKCGSENPGYYD